MSSQPKLTLAERFWSLATSQITTSTSPQAIVQDVLAILDAMERGEEGREVTSRTMSFLTMLHDAETRGDLGYAAPEQIRGEHVDERSVVFSVGVLLFERLTGRHPFGAEGNATKRVARIERGEFGSGVNYFPNVPPELRTILMAAMGPSRKDRYSNLRELRRRLEQFLDSSRGSPHLPGAPVPKKRVRTGVRGGRTRF